MKQQVAQMSDKRDQLVRADVCFLVKKKAMAAQEVAKIIQIIMKHVNYALREGIDSHHFWEFEQLNRHHLREHMTCTCKAAVTCFKHKRVPQGGQSVMR